MCEPCPKCDTDMLPADDFECSQVEFVCPECAPDFVLMRASTFADVDVPSDEWNDKY